MPSTRPRPAPPAPTPSRRSAFPPFRISAIPHFRISLLSVCFLALLVPAAAAQTPAPDIRISAPPGQPGAAITVVFPPGSEQDAAIVPVFVGQGGDTPIAGATLYGELTDCQGQPLTQGTVRFLQPDADEPLGPIDLPPGAGQQRARLSVANLGALYGTFCGFLAAEVDGQHYAYNQLTVQRPAAPDVAIREADAANGIRLTTPGPTLNEALFVSETGGQAGVSGVRITISPLRATGGATAVLDQPPAFDLNPGASAVVSLTGAIPSVASYRGVLRLEAGASATEYDLVVQRQAMTTTVRMETVAPVQRMIAPLFTRLGSIAATGLAQNRFLSSVAPNLVNKLVTATSVDIPLTIQETAGAATAVYYPSVAALQEVNADDSRSTAQYGPPILFNCDGLPVAVTAENGQPAELQLQSYESACLRFAVPGLDRAGKYAARLDLRSPTGGNSSQEVSIRLKDHWILAGLVIFLGALLSYFLRSWTAIGRPAQIKKLAIVRHAALVRETIPDPADPIRVALLGKLNDLLVELDVNPTRATDADLKEVVDALNTYKSVLAVTTLDVAESVPAVHQPEVRKAIGEINALLRQVDPLAHLAAAKDKAEALRQQIDQWNQAELEQGIQALRTSLAADRAGLAKLGLPATATAAYEARLAAFEAGLPQNEAVAAAVQSDYAGARQAYRQAADQYARLAPVRLRLVLQNQRRPAGFTAAEWAEQKGKLLDQLKALEDRNPDLVTLQAEVAALRAEVLAAAIAKLATKTDDLATDLGADEANKDKVTELRQASATLADATQALGEGRTDEAETLYLQAAEAYGRANPNGERRVGEAGVALAAVAGPDLAGLAAVQPGQPVARAADVAQPPPVSAIVAGIKQRDRLALVVVSLVSVVVGLSLLWVPDATFGGLADYIAVFLWGFGLHQLNAVALPQLVRSQELPWFPALNQQQQQPEEQP